MCFFHNFRARHIQINVVGFVILYWEVLEMGAQLANTIQADIGPSNRYRHIGPTRVADLGPSGFAPWANVDSTSAPHRQTQQPSIGPMMGRCLAFLNRHDAGCRSACHRHTHQPTIFPMMGSCPLLHHWIDAGSTSANSSAQYRPDDDS